MDPGGGGQLQPLHQQVSVLRAHVHVHTHRLLRPGCVCLCCYDNPSRGPNWLTCCFRYEVDDIDEEGKE